jgi:hemerythrin
MEKITWTDDYSVGNQDMDIQHKKIINMINALIDARNSSAQPSSLHQALYDMFRYSKGHLYDEERLLRKIAFDDLEQHVQKHEEYIEKMALLSYSASFDESETFENLIVFLKDWWEKHILVEDMKYAVELKSSPTFDSD